MPDSPVDAMDIACDSGGVSSTLLRRLGELRRAPGVVHPRFGDLALPDAVRIAPLCTHPQEYAECDDVIVHLTVTGRCNARCEGCINTSLDAGCRPRGEVATEFECDPVRDAATIVRVAQASGERSVTIALYGGEPLLEVDRVLRLMRILEATPIASRVRYMLYTNGQLLERVLRESPGLFHGVKLLSVSIDGDAEQHCRFRAGTDLATIEAGLVEARRSFHGEVLFWSTLRERQSLRSCFDQFLAYHDLSLVGHFFFHWAESLDVYHDFPAYLRRYGEDLEYVVRTYVERLRQGSLLSIVHLNELILYLSTGRVRGHSACAVELAENYDIVGGRLTACADLPLSVGELPDNAVEQGAALDLSSLVLYRGFLGCEDCGVYSYCGGRCPVQVLAGSPERTLQICQLMRLHVGIVQESMDDISQALAAQGITCRDLYQRSAYLTRFTDVVP
jgi:uncharacterized protein